MGSQVVRVAPHSTIPGVLTPIFQQVPFRKILAEVTRFGKRGDDVLYQPTVSRINTPTAIGQQWRGNVDSATYSISQLSFPYYTIMARAEFDPNQESKFERLISGIGLEDFLNKLCQQGIYQREHYSTLFGFDTDANQGIILEGTVAALPADSSAKTKITEYNITELLQVLAGYARDIMTATYGMAKPVVIISTTEMINYLQSIVVPFTNYQMPGAGVDSIAGAYNRIIGTWLGVGKIEWISDEAMVGKGAAGTDLISFIAPGLSKQESEQPENTNLVAESMPQNMRNTMVDMVDGLKEFPNPVINGVRSKLFSLQTTPGCLIRPEAVVTIEFTYD